MKTQSLLIYHCLRCGKVIHSDSDAHCPKCCGREMVNALADTVHDLESEFSDSMSASACTPFQSTRRDRRQPR